MVKVETNGRWRTVAVKWLGVKISDWRAIENTGHGAARTGNDLNEEAAEASAAIRIINRVRVECTRTRSAAADDHVCAGTGDWCNTSAGGCRRIDYEPYVDR